MATQPSTVIVVGAGIFGVTAALELAQRGYAVQLFDPGPLPHPDAASTDISKVLRMDYGADEFYFDLMEAAFEGWDQWNTTWETPLFHQTGFLMLSRAGWQPGGFEYDSFQILTRRGHPAERVDSRTLREKYPAWNAELYTNGYFNPRAGWAESGKVVAKLIDLAVAAGAELYAGKVFSHLLEDGSKVNGIRTTDGTDYYARHVIVAGGAWTPILLPFLEDVMWATGQPVYHFRPDEPKRYQPPQFPVWNADIASTGWYGFPTRDDGTLKIANHGPGHPVDPRGPRVVPAQEEARFRAFLAESLPGLEGALKIGERLCLYCDTFDGDFWIAEDPDREGLIVSTGGSGHAFKFAPMLGMIAADVLEGKLNRFADRFRWRARGDLRTEDARYTG